VARSGAGIVAAIAFPPGVVEPVAVEITSVVSFKPGTIVCEVGTVTVVAAPGRVVIVGITGILRFTNLRSGIVATAIGRGRLVIPGLIVTGLVIHRGGLLIDRRWSGVDGRRRHIYPDAGNAKTDTGVYIYL
jgi:hypothetical protein